MIWVVCVWWFVMGDKLQFGYLEVLECHAELVEAHLYLVCKPFDRLRVTGGINYNLGGLCVVVCYGGISYNLSS
jgi:hypothetical protein